MTSLALEWCMCVCVCLFYMFSLCVSLLLLFVLVLLLLLSLTQHIVAVIVACHSLYNQISCFVNSKCRYVLHDKLAKPKYTHTHTFQLTTIVTDAKKYQKEKSPISVSLSPYLFHSLSLSLCFPLVVFFYLYISSSSLHYSWRK